MFDINNFNSHGNSFEVNCFDSEGNQIDHLTQWDVNQELYVEHWNYEHTPVFNFCNTKSEMALVVKGSIESDGRAKCSIPNILLTEHYPISVFVYLESDTAGRTIHISQIPVWKKPKPNDYEYRENIEYISWVKLEAEVLAYVEGIEEAFGSAKENADRAVAAAAESLTSKEAAEALVNIAEEALSNSEESLSQANEAIEIARNLNNSVENAVQDTLQNAERAENAIDEIVTHLTNADDNATLSKSYAVGGTNTRVDEDTDNAKYYYVKIKDVVDNKILIATDDDNGNVTLSVGIKQ